VGAERADQATTPAGPVGKAADKIRPTRPSTPSSLLLRLQRAAGNRAVTNAISAGAVAVQRDPPLATTGTDTPTTDGQFDPLTGDRWEGNALLDATARDKARVKDGSDPEAVRLVQQALVDVKSVTGKTYNLGTSGPAKNGVDGVYGGATGRAVQAFKRDESLGFTQFADVGPRTMHRLDDLLGATDLDEPQRDDPSKAKTKPSTPDELDVENAKKQKAPAGTVADLFVKLSTKPPDKAGVLSALQGQDIPTMYVTIHTLHDSFKDEFTVLKGLVTAGSLLELRIKVICDAVENDQDMPVLEWELFATETQLASLPKADRDAILLAYDSRYPTLQLVKASPGFQKLPTDEQVRFLVYVGGTNLISRRAGLRLATEITTPKFDRSKPQTFRNYLKAESSLKQLDDKTGVDPFAHRPVSSTQPADAGNRSFRSKPGQTPAERVDVTIGAAADPDKVTIPVFRPKAAALKPNLKYHTFADVEKGLSVVPGPNAKEIKRVDIEPAFNRDDPHWKKAYKDPNFQSYMTAGADGIVSVYPSGASELPGDIYMGGSFIHETGHIIGNKTFGRNPQGPKWKPWRDAMASDKLHPSDYAKNSPSEDFSEMLLLARTVKGKRREREIRNLFPARMAILDSMKLT
jgi:peptidoglycan hydrolase-like protein with peptidoglycan-binding domain